MDLLEINVEVIKGDERKKLFILAIAFPAPDLSDTSEIMHK